VVTSTPLFVQHGDALNFTALSTTGKASNTSKSYCCCMLWVLLSQDLLDLPRVQDAELAYSSAAAGGRMVQDYRRCSTGCLDGSWQPADAASRDTSVLPYGQFGDYYVRRWAGMGTWHSSWVGSGRTWTSDCP
jgi:hypothetical protein